MNLKPLKGLDLLMELSDIAIYFLLKDELVMKIKVASRCNLSPVALLISKSEKPDKRYRVRR